MENAVSFRDSVSETPSLSEDLLFERDFLKFRNFLELLRKPRKRWKRYFHPKHSWFSTNPVIPFLQLCRFCSLALLLCTNLSKGEEHQKCLRSYALYVVELVVPPLPV